MDDRVLIAFSNWRSPRSASIACVSRVLYVRLTDAQFIVYTEAAWRARCSKEAWARGVLDQAAAPVAVELALSPSQPPAEPEPAPVPAPVPRALPEPAPPRSSARACARNGIARTNPNGRRCWCGLPLE